MIKSGTLFLCAQLGFAFNLTSDTEQSYKPSPSVNSHGKQSGFVLQKHQSAELNRNQYQGKVVLYGDASLNSKRCEFNELIVHGQLNVTAGSELIAKRLAVTGKVFLEDSSAHVDSIFTEEGELVISKNSSCHVKDMVIGEGDLVLDQGDIIICR